MVNFFGAGFATQNVFSRSIFFSSGKSYGAGCKPAPAK